MTEFSLKEIDFLKSFPKRIVLKGENLFSSGDFINCIYYLEKGEISRNTFTETGEELVYEVRRASKDAYSFIGVTFLFGSAKVSSMNFTAVTDCVCYRISMDDCLKFLRQKPIYIEELLSMTVNNYNELNMNFVSKRSGRSGNMICNYLINNASRDQGTYWYTGKINNTELGRRLGIHRVTVSKIINALIQEGVVEKTDSGIRIIDNERIEEYAHGLDTIIY